MKKINRKSLRSPALIWIMMLVLLGLILGGLTERVLQQESMFRLDAWVLVHTEQFQSTSLTKIMILITNLGGGWFIWPLALILLIYCIRSRRKYEALFVAAVMSGGWILLLILKTTIQRARPMPPSGNALINAWGWSYPSGHVVLSFLFYFTLAYIVSRRIDSGAIRWSAFLFAFFLTALIALSRVYLQVHYMSDVVAGFLSGSLWFIFCIAISGHYRLK